MLFYLRKMYNWEVSMYKIQLLDDNRKSVKSGYFNIIILILLSCADPFNYIIPVKFLTMHQGRHPSCCVKH